MSIADINDGGTTGLSTGTDILNSNLEAHFGTGGSLFLDVSAVGTMLSMESIIEALCADTIVFFCLMREFSPDNVALMIVCFLLAASLLSE